RAARPQRRRGNSMTLRVLGSVPAAPVRQPRLGRTTDDSAAPKGRATASRTRQTRIARGGRSRPPLRNAGTLRTARGAECSDSLAGSKAMALEGTPAPLQQEAQALHFWL